MDLPQRVKKTADFSDGRCALECSFCEGTGTFPKTDSATDDDVETEVCPVCKGSGIGVVAEPNDVLVWCRHCDASGRGFNDYGVFEGETCPACGGCGLLNLSVLRLGQSPATQAETLVTPTSEADVSARSRRFGLGTGPAADPWRLVVHAGA